MLLVSKCKWLTIHFLFPSSVIWSGGDGSADWASPLLPNSYRWITSTCTPEPALSTTSFPSSPSASPCSFPTSSSTFLIWLPLVKPLVFPPIPPSSGIAPDCYDFISLWRAVAAPWTPRAHWPCWWASSLPLYCISPSGVSEVWCLFWCTPRSQSLITLDHTMFTPTSVIWGCHLPHLATLALDPLPLDHHWKTARSRPHC